MVLQQAVPALALLFPRQGLCSRLHHQESKKAAPPLFPEGLLPPKAPPAGFDESIAVVSNTLVIRKMPPPLVDPWAAPGEDRIIDPWAAAPAAARG